MTCAICGTAFDEHGGCVCGEALTREQLAPAVEALGREQVLMRARRVAGKRDLHPHSRRINFDTLPERTY